MHDRTKYGGWVVYVGKNVNAMAWKMLMRLYTEISWVHCNTKNLTLQGGSCWLISQTSILHAKFYFYASALLNKTDHI